MFSMLPMSLAISIVVVSGKKSVTDWICLRRLEEKSAAYMSGDGWIWG
jgi:hypothetical protein